MKKSFKAITSLVLMVLVLMSLSVSAFAAAPVSHRFHHVPR